MIIRQATAADGVQVAPLINIVFTEMEIPALMKMPEADVLAVFADAFKEAPYRYSYAHTVVAEEDGVIQGIAVGYPASDEAHIDDAFQPYLHRLGIPADKKLFTWPETFPGDWYLDTLAVKPAAQRRGIGGKLLDDTSRRAKAAGMPHVGLCCDLDNPNAQALYERHGFKDDGRVRIFDHMYRHMSKQVD